MSHFNKFVSYLHNASTIIGLSTLPFTLISCGGGGGGGSTPPSATITSISPAGFVASGTQQAIILTGTNFTSGMTLSISGTGISTINIPTPTINAGGDTISSNVTISSAPTDKYVTVSLKSGTTTLASTILGIASVSKTLATDIQPIFNTYCTACHGTGAGVTVDYLNLTSTPAGSNTQASVNLINAYSVHCTQKYRVTPGDPRPTSNVLINKVQSYTTSTSPTCNGVAMPKGYTATPTFTSAEVTAIIEWVAGGAH